MNSNYPELILTYQKYTPNGDINVKLKAKLDFKGSTAIKKVIINIDAGVGYQAGIELSEIDARSLAGFISSFIK